MRHGLLGHLSEILTLAPVSDLQDFNTGEPHESAPWELALTQVSENRYAAA